jgi:hypothetical protein
LKFVNKIKLQYKILNCLLEFKRFTAPVHFSKASESLTKSKVGLRSIGAGEGFWGGVGAGFFPKNRKMLGRTASCMISYHTTFIWFLSRSFV